MANTHSPEDDAVPLRIRTRRTLAASGETSITSSVACRRRAGDVPVHTCLTCPHAAALISLPDGAAHLYCRDPEAAEADVLHLPARVAPLHVAPSQSLADRMPVSVIMSADVVCVRPDVSIAALTVLLIERGISGVPVVDAAGAPLGVVSKTDLVREPGSALTVSDIMTSMTFALPETATIAQAGALMAYEGIHRVPITGSDGSVIGIVAALDVLRWMAKQDGYILRD